MHNINSKNRNIEKERDRRSGAIGKQAMVKYVFVLGGVVSGLGKGITAASLGRLLKARGYSVTMQKLDPYFNLDPGTMNPLQHGEVCTPLLFSRAEYHIVLSGRYSVGNRRLSGRCRSHYAAAGKLI